MAFSYKQICTLLVCLTLTSSTFGKTIFVNSAASGAENGQSWTDAYTTLTAALQSAAAGDEIWVAAGTYFPTAGTDRNASFNLTNAVEVLGGFPNTGTPNLSNRNPNIHVTILSGDIDQDGTPSNNAYTIIYTKDVNASTILDGFTIMGGNADGEFNEDFPVLRSFGGGAWYNEASNGTNSNPSIRNCIFKDNYANNRGGALFSKAALNGHTNYTINDCSFQNNTAGLDGGAIFNSQAGSGSLCNPIISNTEFSNNTAVNSGGAIYNNGAYFGEVSGNYTNCLFIGNHATNKEGGAIYNNAFFQGISSPIFTDCDFLDNSADTGSGGAIYNDASGSGVANFQVRNCLFSSNTSVVYGGAICNIISNNGEIKPTYANSIFEKNTSNNGGATYSRGAFGSNLDVVVANCVFYQNIATVGGTIYQNEAGSTSLVTTKVSNSIFLGNTAGFSPTFHLTGPSSIGVNNTIFDAANCLSLVFGDGNSEADCLGANLFNTDPQFIDADNGDFHVLASSPAIDAGNNTDVPQGISEDLDSNPRIANGTVDIGVYEQGNTNADNDGDGILDANDNCSLVANADQLDQDNDGAGNVCDCDDSPTTGSSCSTGCTTFYLDADNDSFGNPAISLTTCVAPAGYVSNNQDFDDNDADLYPNAPELCDGKDNNNNGQTDEGTDDDNDGVCNGEDVCPGGDDTIDLNNNNIPDACESQITLNCPNDITIDAAAGQTTAAVSWTEPTGSTDCNGGGTGGTTTCEATPISGFSYKGNFNGSNYYLSDGAAIWTIAEATAEANGGYLVVIEDQAENDFVKGIIGSNIIHIGLSDANTEGTYEWINGATFDYSNFDGTPGSKDYGVLFFWNGKWVLDGNYTKKYLIEVPCTNGMDSGLDITQTAGLPNGGNFPIGTSTVEYTATDDCDGVISCSFTVTVNATNSNLLVTCPTNIIATTEPGETTKVVNWTEPTTSSDCTTGNVTATPSIPNGTAFAIGTTTITYTVSDGCGGTATCSFDVIVNEGTSDLTVTCPSDITVTANPGETTKVVTWTEPIVSSNCTTGNITTTPSVASGSAFPIGTTTVSYAVTDGCGGTANCSFTVTVNEGTSTVILNCPADITMDAAPGAISKIINYNIPAGNTTCATGNVNLELLNGLESGAAFPIGTTIVEYRGTDECGSSDVCSFSVTINALGSDIILNCPTDITATVNSATETVSVTWDDPTGNSTCNIGGYSITQSSGPTKSSQFGVGTTTIIYTAMDDCGGSIDCSFTVTVNVESSNISLECPTNITLTVPQGSGGGIATWSAPTATTDCTTGNTSNEGGNCTGVPIAGFTYLGEFNGSDYYISDSKAPWLTARTNCETAGGTLACIENQAENDYIKSIIGGEIVHIGLTDEASEGTPVWLNGEPFNFTMFSQFTPNAEDKDFTVFYFWDGSWDWQNNNTWKNYLLEIKCGGSGTVAPVVTQTEGLPSGSTFPVGNSTVTYQATDDCGNLTTCSFTVTVTETVLTCVPDNNGGQITGNEIICDPYDPQTITSNSLPSGGTGSIEYVWLKSESGCPTNIAQAIPNSNSASYNPPFITTTTYYVRWSRRENCTEWVASNCITKTVDDCGSSTNYCDLSAEQPWQEWISNVSLADLSKSSGKSLGYDDYTNLVANVSAGQAYTLSVQITFSYNQWDENIYVWIDWNQDNDFNDPNELVLDQVSLSNGNGGPQPDAITQTFTVPANALAGTTRMRVAMKREASANPCNAPIDGYIHGEVEDYTVNVSASASNRAAPSLAFEAYPAEGDAVLEWFSNTTDLEENFEIEHSVDNVHFKRLKHIDVDYQADFNHFYKLIDQYPARGANYYRIKQTFKDGQITYTESQKLVYGEVSSNIHFYPNPARDYLRVELNEYAGKKGNLQIVNMLGQVLHHRNLETITDNTIEIPLDNLENGMHLLLINLKNRPILTETFVVERLR